MTHADSGNDAERVVSVVMALGAGRVRLVYEGTMIVLALAVVWLLTQPYQGWVVAADWTIWAVFAIDYLARLAPVG